MGGFLPAPQVAVAGFPYNALLFTFGPGANIVSATSSDGNVTAGTLHGVNGSAGQYTITWTAGLFSNFFFYYALPVDTVVNPNTGAYATDQGSLDGNISVDVFVNNVLTNRGCYIACFGN